MPLHDFRCPQGHVTEQFVEQGVKWINCPKCGICTPECAASHLPGYEVLHLGFRADLVFLKFPAAFVQVDICYDSPIDGRIITSRQARHEDLKRNNCREYDPSEKQEAIRNRAREDARLDKEVDQSVEAVLSTWSPRKKELLEQEVRAGVTAEVNRNENGT